MKLFYNNGRKLEKTQTCIDGHLAMKKGSNDSMTAPTCIKVGVFLLRIIKSFLPPLTFIPTYHFSSCHLL